MTTVTYTRKYVKGLMVSEGLSPAWQNKGMAAGTAQSSYLDPQTGSGRRTLGMVHDF